jgi:uncharacterized protein
VGRSLVVRVADLLREPGSSRDLRAEADLGELSTSVAGTVPGALIAVDARVMGMAGGVEVTGTVSFDWQGTCRRCLGDVTGREAVQFREVAQRDPVDDEVLPIDGDLFDAEPLVRELVLASLPVAPLCAADCAGPDPDRFPTTTEAAVEAEAEEQGDPRWAALSELQFDEPTSDP